MVRITEVEKGSRAEKAGIEAGDILVSLNRHEIRDVLDYRFYLTSRQVDIAFLRDGAERRVRIRKEEYDDVGLAFETPLMDQKHACANRCIFCFIDQLPKGLRETLYFKDDDSRLSFLHGNYITLTNLSDADIDRIIEMHISPVNISVHTTNPDLRVKMMKNKNAGKVLSYLGRLAEAGNAICGQIVLCKGYNDGEELMRTMRDLTAYLPALRSVSVVPAGLTKFREGLTELSPFTPDEAGAVIDAVEQFGGECLRKYGSRLFFCSDEFYLEAGREIPSDGFYEDYTQIENGVGMLRSLETEVKTELKFLGDYFPDGKTECTPPRHISAVCGLAAQKTVGEILQTLTENVKGLRADLYPIVNQFFGESITVSGLLTGTDIAEQLAGKDLGEALLLPANTLRAEGDLFLCGMRPDELSEKLGVPLIFVRDEGASLVAAVLGREAQ